MGDPKETTNRLVYTFVNLAELALGARAVFSLLNFDINNSFVRWVYSMSDTLLEPFTGLYPEEAFDHTYVLEFRVLFAMAAYALVGFLSLAIVRWAGSDNRPTSRSRRGGWRKWLRDRLA